MNTIQLTTPLFAAGFLGLCLSASAETFLRDSFVTDTTSDATNGVYEADGALSGGGNQNREVTGGSTVGYAAGEVADFWASSGTGLPILTSSGLSSGSVDSSGGAVNFRGNDTTDDRMAYRTINPYTGPTSTYFSASLSTNLIDDDATSLVAFTNAGESARGTNILNNGSSGYYNGVAMGFVGDGNGGMDLVLRYRTETTSVYADEVLASGIATDTTYTVMGRIDWESSSQNLREDFTVWLNPESSTEPSITSVSLTGFLGDSTNIDSVYFLQRNFGDDLSQSVIMDEVRLGSSWEDLSPIPEPSVYGAALALAAFACVGVRRGRMA